MKKKNTPSKTPAKPAKPARVVNIAVVLEDNAKERELMKKMAANDASLNYTICPRDPDEWFKYIRSLKARNIQVGKMVLMGHGNATSHHIGGFFPGDADVDALKTMGKTAAENYQRAVRDEKTALRKLKRAKTAAKKKELKEIYATAQADTQARKETAADFQAKLRLVDEMSDSMAPGARIGLFNCFSASDQKGEKFMQDIGNMFLHRHGGDILGCTARVWTVSTHPVMEALFGSYDTDVYTWGKWVRHAVPAQATHCNGHNHKPTCTCGWGGPR